MPRNPGLVVHRRTGCRSAIAVSILLKAGVPAIDLVGGIAAWNASGPAR